MAFFDCRKCAKRYDKKRDMIGRQAEVRAEQELRLELDRRVTKLLDLLCDIAGSDEESSDDDDWLWLDDLGMDDEMGAKSQEDSVEGHA